MFGTLGSQRLDKVRVKNTVWQLRDQSSSPSRRRWHSDEWNRFSGSEVDKLPGWTAVVM